MAYTQAPDVDAYPLAWPSTHLRTPASKRERARFNSKGSSGAQRSVTVAEGRDRVLDALEAYTPGGGHRRIPSRSIIISTNVPPARKGRGPAGGQREPDDPGVCVYFELDGHPYALPSDAWDTVGGNLAAVAAHLEALRGIARWKVGSSEQAFRGYAALPAAGEGSGTPWWDVLGVARTVSLADAKRAWQGRALKLHPDVAGTSPEARQAWDALQQAWDQARAALAAGQP